MACPNDRSPTCPKSRLKPIANSAKITIVVPRSMNPGLPANGFAPGRNHGKTASAIAVHSSGCRRNLGTIGSLEQALDTEEPARPQQQNDAHDKEAAHLDGRRPNQIHEAGNNADRESADDG